MRADGGRKVYGVCTLVREYVTCTELGCGDVQTSTMEWDGEGRVLVTDSSNVELSGDQRVLAERNVKT